MCSLEGICFLLGPLLCCNALAVVVTVADVFQTAICETSAQQFRVTSKEGKRAMLDAKKIARMNKVIAGGKARSGRGAGRSDPGDRRHDLFPKLQSAR